LIKPKKSVKQRILNVLFWSIISAAFIGPGTVTTATKAGVFFHYDLMWTMVFSVIACLLLQEASARIAIFSGMNLGEAIAMQFRKKKSKVLIFILIIGAIVLGSAAYETGNILGSVEGLSFIFGSEPEQKFFFLELKQWFVLLIGFLAFFAFRMKSIRSIAQVLGAFVYIMGFTFVLTAIFVRPDISKMMTGIFVPTIPKVSGAGILILGIIGTTVVPYDLFLGSGIVDKTQTIKEARLGLSISIILGGIISMSIMTVGSSISEGMGPEFLKNLDFDFKLMKSGLYLNSHINDYAVYIFGFGMFAAGFTSAITAPLASAITARSIFPRGDWRPKSFRFQGIAVGILLVGVFFGMKQIKPVPAIILAQALNGLILPFISVFMLIIINNPRIMKNKLNSHFSNILLGIVVWITLLMGTLNVFKALFKTFSFEIQNQDLFFIIIALINFAITAFVMYRIYVHRKTILTSLNEK